MDDVEAARRETIRYHEELYARQGERPTGWLARPHRLVVDAAARIDRPVHAYDLGAGLGRHTLLLAAELPTGSHVTAVDLVPAAVAGLAGRAERAGLGDRVDVVRADLETYRFPAADAGLVVVFSAVEHVRSPAAARAVLDRCREATRPGGLHVVAIFADRREVGPQGTRPALVECPMTSEQARDLLRRSYRSWDVLVEACVPASAAETRDGEAYELLSTLVAVVARAPDGRLAASGRPV